MLTRVRVMLVVMAAAAPAHAMFVDNAAPRQEAVPEIVVSAPEDPLVSLVGLTADAREVGETSVVTLQLQLDGPVDAHTGRMAVTLPPGAEVVGLTFARGGEHLVASARAAVEATQAFEQTRVIKRDPALLEWKDRSALQLSLYPVTGGEHATATVTLTLPRFRALRVDAAGMHRELIGGTFAAPTDDEVALARQAPAVTSTVSLLAMPPPTLDDFDVRIQNNQPELHQCFVASRGGPADVTLLVVVGADGNVSETNAGDSAAGTCVARLASTWRFGADARPVAMHLRLHLSPG